MAPGPQTSDRIIVLLFLAAGVKAIQINATTENVNATTENAVVRNKVGRGEMSNGLQVTFNSSTLESALATANSTFPVFVAFSVPVFNQLTIRFPLTANPVVFVLSSAESSMETLGGVGPWFGYRWDTGL